MTKPKVQTRKVWLVFGFVGPYRCICNTRREARVEARMRNRGDFKFAWKPYRVVRAELRYPVKGKGRKDNA